MTRRRSTKKAQPYTDARPDALELMGRMLVGSSYRVPVVGKGTKPGLQATDIAGAAGLMTTRLGREVALAVSTRADRQAVAVVAMHAYGRLARTVLRMRPPRALDLRSAADRWRLRMIAFDAAMELVHPERRQPYQALARASKMRKADYIRVHQAITAELQELMNNASREFGGRLWGLFD
ncbi:MAG TPA: hypothetical protein VGE09_03305 [Pseudoxanthomonas sp.]